MNEALVVPLVGTTLGLLCLGVSLHLRKKYRLLHDLPTAKAQGVFIGLVELKGTAECDAPLESYLSATACVQYAFNVEEYWSRTVTETYTDKDGQTQTRTREESGWTSVASEERRTPFYLQDDTGAVRVLPAGAKVEATSLFAEECGPADSLYYGKGPDTVIANSRQRRRFTERGVPLHAALFVIGRARERSDVVAPEIAADPSAELFLISTRSEEKVKSSYGLWSWFFLALGGVLGIGSMYYEQPQWGPHAAAGFLLLSLGGWTWMAFNSLVSLRNRCQQGWSLVDIELKRRHDLIPQIAATVEGLRSHEQSVQTGLASLRAQQAATRPGEPGADFEGVAPGLRAIVERYPELKSEAAFAALQKQLVETEQRIALARAYYNDIATHFATRLEIVPDGWLARTVGMKAPVLFVAENFERAVVPANLTT